MLNNNAPKFTHINCDIHPIYAVKNEKGKITLTNECHDFDELTAEAYTTKAIRESQENINKFTAMLGDSINTFDKVSTQLEQHMQVIEKNKEQNKEGE
ncbi:hypothetical protein [Capybara microvirus Cap1_SP_60]|nr:hypothetical protein [Capybara microvirus Cap1_SP_60]